MNRFIDELHNHEEAANVRDSVLLFLGGVIVLVAVGSVFWSAF